MKKTDEKTDEKRGPIFEVRENITLEAHGYVMNSRTLYESQGMEFFLSPKQNFRGFFKFGKRTEWQWFETEKEAKEWVEQKIKNLKNHSVLNPSEKQFFVLAPQEDFYYGANGFKIKRNSSHPFNWEFIDPDGKAIDKDKYRNDLAERNNIELFRP